MIEGRRLAARSVTRNLASATRDGHPEAMRRLVLLLCLSVAACAPRPQPTPAPQQPAEVTPVQRQTALVGMTTSELVGHFGKPALQVREGTSLKLQFRGQRCVLDAYLYPAHDAVLRVSYVDTRAPSGVDMDQAACISALQSSS